MDGLNSPEELMDAAKEIGHTHLAITDHGTLSSHRETQQAAEKTGIIPILGCEMYLSPTDRWDRRDVKKREDNTQLYNHLVVLAKNQNGLKNLQHLSEVAWREGYYYKPRIDKEILSEFGDDLVILSGCLNGVISKAIERGNEEEAHGWLRFFKERFGDDFYIELQPDNPLEINAGLLAYADMYNIKPTVTADCHFARPEDRAAEEAMLILSTGAKRNKDYTYENTKHVKDIFERYNLLYPDRPISFEKLDLFIRERGDMYATLEKQGTARQDMFDSTVEIADKITGYEFYENLELLPSPKAQDPMALLRKKAYAGLRERGMDGDPKNVERLEEELGVIEAKNFPSYFIIEANLIKWARSQGIRVGPGRGSAAGSLLCYCLRITDVDPMKYGLLFFRFINPERNDFPDIDTDFEDRRRKEVKEYMRRQYKYVGGISTYTKFGGKNVVKDAARVFGVPLAEVNKALKTVQAPPDRPEMFTDLFEKSEAGRAFIKKYPEVWELSAKLRGRIKSVGMHAGGVVVSKEPIENYVPLETRADPLDKVAGRVPVIAYDMEQIADIGFIKYDILALKTLSVISDTVDMVKKRRGEEIVLEDLEFDDPNIYEQLSSGYTVGIFQADQPAYTSLLKDMRVDNFEDLAVSNALVRPGAKNTVGQIYIDRKHGKQVVNYAHPSIKEITETTYGVIIYQEQVMLCMTELAGMKMATADKVRKIIGKKKDVKEFEQYKAEFVEGASKNVSKAVAEGLWHDFEAHAGYSFNRSHAVAYSMITYWTAWLKQNYPLEYMYALLLNEDDNDKHTTYLIECKRLGIKVLLPHVNKSELNFTIEGDAIRFGLVNVKFLGEASAYPIIEKRPFTSYNHLLTVAEEKNSGINARAVGALNKVGGAVFDDNPRRGDESDYFYEYLNIPKFGTHQFPQHTLDLITTLEDYEEGGAYVLRAMVKNIKKGKGWSRVELVDETGTAGIFHNEDTQIEKGQMYFMLVANNRIARYITAGEIWEALEVGDSPDGFIKFLTQEQVWTTPGFYYVVTLDRRKTKAGKLMGTLVLANDKKEMRSIIVFPGNFSKAYGKAKEGTNIQATFKKLDDGGLCLGDIYE
jgi:DNA polymerase-3 subunit alpha